MNTLSQNVRSLALPIVLFGEVFLANCSTLSLTYQYADWVMHWKINHYLDITSEQYSYLDNRLNSFKKWHKTEEVPRYISFIKYVKTQWNDGLTQQKLDSIFMRYQDLWENLSLQLAAESAPFLRTLNSDQIHSLQVTMREDNQELLDQRARNHLDHMEKKIEKIVDRLEDWVGPLTLDQKFQVDQHIRKLPDTFQAWFDNRVRRQSVFIAILKQQANEQRLQQEIGKLLSTPDQGASDAYLVTMQQQKTEFFSIILAIDQTITPRQREHAMDQIENLISELKRIAHE